MKTIKLPIQNKIDIIDLQRIYSSIVRYAFNRFQENLSLKEVRLKSKEIFEGQFPATIREYAIGDAKVLFERFKKKKIIFGGKANLIRYVKGLISKENFKTKRLLPIHLFGVAYYKGNQFINLDLENNKVVFKKTRKEHIEIQVAKLRGNQRKELLKIQELAQHRKIPYTVTLTSDYICFTFDELYLKIQKFSNLKENRILGIDLNPNFIGVSILEFDKNDSYKVIHKQLFETSKLNIKSRKDSSNSKSRYIINKREYELFQICHQINSLINYWKCKKISFEDLQLKSVKENYSKEKRRQINHDWRKALIFNKMKMLANLYGYEFIEINPCYTSFIGNLNNFKENAPDPVLASIEIARRAYKKFTSGWFYPIFNIETLDEQWKQTLSGVENWKQAYNKIKDSKMWYRIQLKDLNLDAVFSKFYTKKHWKLYQFS